MAVSQTQQASITAVPNLINYSGTLVLSNGVGVPGKTVGVTFAIYRQQDDGAPLWLETQNVTPDSTGRYTVLLGSTKGIPAGVRRQAFFLISDNQNSPWVFKVSPVRAGSERSPVLPVGQHA
jgi:hypothetical protein